MIRRLIVTIITSSATALIITLLYRALNQTVLK